jgi:hypothetical protein
MKMITTERKLVDTTIFVLVLDREKDENRPCRSILKTNHNQIVEPQSSRHRYAKKEGLHGQIIDLTKL